MLYKGKRQMLYKGSFGVSFGQNRYGSQTHSVLSRALQTNLSKPPPCHYKTVFLCSWRVQHPPTNPHQLFPRVDWR